MNRASPVRRYAPRTAATSPADGIVCCRCVRERVGGRWGGGNLAEDLKHLDDERLRATWIRSHHRHKARTPAHGPNYSCASGVVARVTKRKRAQDEYEEGGGGGVGTAPKEGSCLCMTRRTEASQSGYIFASLRALPVTHTSTHTCRGQMPYRHLIYGEKRKRTRRGAPCGGCRGQRRGRGSAEPPHRAARPPPPSVSLRPFAPPRAADTSRSIENDLIADVFSRVPLCRDRARAWARCWCRLPSAAPPLKLPLPRHLPCRSAREMRRGGIEE